MIHVVVSVFHEIFEVAFIVIAASIGKTFEDCFFNPFFLLKRTSASEMLSGSLIPAVSGKKIAKIAANSDPMPIKMNGILSSMTFE